MFFVYGPCFYAVLCSVFILQSSILAKNERAGCFFFVFLLSYGCRCSMSLSNGAIGDIGCFAVCDCGISCSYSLTFRSFHLYYNQNRSTLLCKLLSYNSLLAVKYFTIIIAKADLF